MSQKNDGIGDEPHWVSDFSCDNYPLMKPLFYLVQATVDINPNTLNLKSKGKWITAFIELPEGYDIKKVLLESIMLNDTIQAQEKPTEIGDFNSNGILDLMVKFKRELVIEIIAFESDETELKITGSIEGVPFEGIDIIRLKK